MKLVKTLAAASCFLGAFFPGMLALGELSFYVNKLAVVCALLFCAIGVFLIRHRSMPMSARMTALILVMLTGLVTLDLAVMIPDFIGRSFESAANACVNNLRQIDSAKDQWALENGKTNGALVTEIDLTPYIKLGTNNIFPSCPAGGTYILGRLGEDPRCSLEATTWPNTHVINNTNSGWWYNFKSAYGLVIRRYL